MPLAGDELLKTLEKHLSLRNFLMFGAFYLAISITLGSFGRPYATALSRVTGSHIGIYINIFFYPLAIFGVIFLGIKRVSLERIALGLLIVGVILAGALPLQNIYFIINGKFDFSKVNSISGTITDTGCSKGRNRTCWIEFSYKGDHWKISPAKRLPTSAGKEIVVTYKTGLLGRTWVPKYQIRGTSA